MFVMNATGEPGDDRIIVNPELSELDGSESSEEGCLSLPELRVQIDRAIYARLRGFDVHGEPIDVSAEGYIARIWQHEFDHLNGIMLIDRMGMVNRALHRGLLKDLENTYAEAHPAPPPAKAAPTQAPHPSQHEQISITIGGRLARLKIIFAGAGEFGAPTLKALLDAGHEVIRVITQPDRPAGRGRTLTPTPIGLLAEQLNLPAIKTSDINSLELPPADLLIVIAFGQKISEAVTHHARLGSINLHASLLPRHRGAAPINAAILSGDTITGNSVIRLAQKMDAGALLGQSSVTIGDIETAGELHDRLSVDGAPLVLRVVEELAAGTSNAIEQDAALATLAKKNVPRDSPRRLDTASRKNFAANSRIVAVAGVSGCDHGWRDAARHAWIGPRTVGEIGSCERRAGNHPQSEWQIGDRRRNLGQPWNFWKCSQRASGRCRSTHIPRGKRFETGLSLRNV